MRSCASPTCASAAASSRRVAACRSIWGFTLERGGQSPGPRGASPRDRARGRQRGRSHIDSDGGGRRERGGRNGSHVDDRGGGRVNFQWPEMLGLLVIVPAVIIAYFILLRRKKKAALRYASLSLVRDAIG